MNNYTFLKSLTKHQFEDNVAQLICEDQVGLQIQFLQEDVFRVTLVRPEEQDALLDYAIGENNWTPVEVEFTENSDALSFRTAALELQISKQPCRLRVLDRRGNVINEDDPGMGIGWWGQEVRNWKSLAKDEKFFGLGEKTGQVDKRGKEWVMWNTDASRYNERTDPLYQSIPFYVGVRDYRAYGIFFNNSYRTRFNFGAGNLRYSSFSAEGGRLDYFFFQGPEVSRVVANYTALTGRTPMPPLWALGYQQSRWSYFPETEVLRIARTFREKQIPADVIHLDIHYMDGYRVFTWDKSRFPEPKKLIAQLKDMGFKVVLIIDPGVKTDPEYQVAKTGLQQDHFVKYPDGQVYTGEVWPGESYFPDFSREETRDWWGAQIQQLAQIGVKGFWNDMNEPSVWGRGFPDEVVFSDEGRIANHKKMHNLYGLLMSQSCYEALKRAEKNERPHVITRAGFAGVQRFSAVWTGDNHANEAHLALGVRMLLGLGLSGVPFVGTDIGGFSGSPSPELYVRWIQAATFAPFFRSHSIYGSPAQDPWSFGEEIENIVRNYIEMRYRYLPYLYSLFWQSHTTGAPILQPMFWHYQDDPKVYEPEFQEQFLVGDALLVAPVTREHEYFKKIYLPAGEWLELSTGIVYEGGKTLIIDAPLDYLPVFQRAGAFLPSWDVSQFVGQRTHERLYLDVFMGNVESGAFEYYDDDAGRFDYLKNTYRLTDFYFRKQVDGTVVFTKNRRHDGYNPGQRMLEVRFLAMDRTPGEILLGNKALSAQSSTPATTGFHYEKKSKVVALTFPDEAGSQEAKITF